MLPDFCNSEPPEPGTHSGLSFFGSSQVLVAFQRGYNEDVFTSAYGPVLEFGLICAKKDNEGLVIDLVNLLLKLAVKLKYLAKSKPESDNDVSKKPVFVSNLMHRSFQNIEVALNGTPVASSSNLSLQGFG